VSSTWSAPRARAGWPTATTRGCCSPGTAGSACWRCPTRSARPTSAWSSSW